MAELPTAINRCLCRSSKYFLFKFSIENGKLNKSTIMNNSIFVLETKG